MLALKSILALTVIGVLPAEEATNDQVQEAVQRSIPYIQEKGAWWIEKKKCVSCHRVNTMVWSLSAARRNGYEVSDRLDEWLKWAADASLSTNEKGKVVGLGNKEGVAQIVFGLDRDAEQDAIRQELVALLLDGQQPDGSWQPGGQLPAQKRPKPETASVSTMWLTLALVNAGPSDESAPAIERAMKSIKESPPGKSTEWYVVQLLLASRRNERGLRDQFVNRLRSQQQADGGWGWLVGEKSDALGTGMAVYALARAGVKRKDPAIKHAQQFLVSTQRDDGSWTVHGTKANRKDRAQETSVYWGTTWAALGLMASLPDQPK